MRTLNSNRRYAESVRISFKVQQTGPNLEDLVLSHTCHVLLIELCAMFDDGEFATDV